jgi:predicted phosphodiesterase
MKIISIGDTHGRLQWKTIVAKEHDADLYVFIGDYFDTRNRGYSGNRQIENFKDILEFKKANPDRVILLFGNHDFHYIKNIGEDYSGYQAGYALEIGELVEHAINKDLVQMCYMHDKYFFSHAGLTKTWVKATLAPNNIDPQVNDVMVNEINDFLKYKPRVFGFSIGENMSMTGDDITQGPIWVRPRSLFDDMVKEIVCVVGHTPVKKIYLNESFPSIIMIDCLGDVDEYLIIKDGVPSVGTF